MRGSIVFFCLDAEDERHDDAEVDDYHRGGELRRCKRQ